MPGLRRVSGTRNEWRPVTWHEGIRFQPPQYISNEINGTGGAVYGVSVEFDGEPATFFHSFHRNRARVTFEINVAKAQKHGLEPGWYHITQGDNDENLNETLSTGMKFQLVP